MIIAVEVRVFFMCGLCGIACGVLYDMFRIIRRAFELKTVATFFMDTVFWILCALLTAGVLFYANYGRLRWYEGVIAVIGAVSYFLSASPLVVDGGVFLVLTVKKILYILLKTVFFPLFLVLKLTNRFFCKIKLFFSKKISKNMLTIRNFWFRIKKRMFLFKRFSRK